MNAVHFRMYLAVALVFSMVLTTACVRMDALPKSDPGIRSQVSQPFTQEQMPIKVSQEATHQYRIGANDVLRVDVLKDPELSREDGYTVTEEGNILMPNVGAIKVVDLTTEEAEKVIAKKLARIIKAPVVKVGVQEYRSKFIYVVGEVASPGQQVMRADALTLLEAITRAGLPTPDASLKRVHLITPDDENPITQQVDLTDILYKGKMKHNALLSPGDIVFVPARQASNVSKMIAELVRPGSEVLSMMYRVNSATD